MLRWCSVGDSDAAAAAAESSWSPEVWFPCKAGLAGPGLQYCTPPPGGRGQPQEWFLPQQETLEFVTDGCFRQRLLEQSPSGVCPLLGDHASPLLQP